MDELIASIRTSLIDDLPGSSFNGFELLMNGLGNTLLITFGALLLGSFLGTLLAIARISKVQWLRAFARLYTEVIRGIPLVVQLLIVYFVIFGSAQNFSPIEASIIAFGFNSAAYIAELIRAGIQAVHKGQFEASMSLGMTKRESFVHIILPQAIRNIFPAIGNETISLIKETAIIGYIGGNDLMRQGYLIRSATYEAAIPLFAPALIYLIMTFLLTQALLYFERKWHVI